MSLGKFIVFEGFEGAGKTTVASAVCKRLNEGGQPTEIGREPGTTAIGEAIREILKRDWDPEDSMCAGTEALLFLAARAQFIRQFVSPRLERGIHVIADRFALSTMAYQVAGRGLPPAQIWSAIRFATEGMLGDLTIILSVSPQIGLMRIMKNGSILDRFEKGGDAFHRRVATGYRKYARYFPGAVTIYTEDKTEEQVFEVVWNEVDAFLRDRR